MFRSTVEYTNRDGEVVEIIVAPSDADVKMVAESLRWSETIPDPDTEIVIAAKRAELFQLIADRKKDTPEFHEVAAELQQLEQNPPGSVLNPETEFEFVAKGLERSGIAWYVQAREQQDAPARQEAENARRRALEAEAKNRLNKGPKEA